MCTPRREPEAGEPSAKQPCALSCWAGKNGGRSLGLALGFSLFRNKRVCLCFAEEKSLELKYLPIPPTPSAPAMQGCHSKTCHCALAHIDLPSFFAFIPPDLVLPPLQAQVKFTEAICALAVLRSCFYSSIYDGAMEGLT